MDTSSTTQVAEIMGKHWRSCSSSRTKLVRPRSSPGAWMGKSTKLGMSVCYSKTRIILFGKRGDDIKMAGKEEEYSSHVEETDEQRWSWRTNFISWSRIFEIYSTWMQTDWNYIWRIYEDVWITYFCWSNWKIPGKASRKDDGVRTCSKNVLSDTVNWQTKKWSSYTNFQAFAWMIINSNRNNLNQWENYHKYTHKLCWNACTWHELGDLTF